MELETLKDLYVHELKDLYSAETQITKALPKMARAAAKNRQLAAAFNQHLEQTKRQSKRLEQVLVGQDESTRGPKCEGMEGLIKEGDKIIQEAADEVRDAGLIAAAQRVEHYEIASYGCARTYAQLLGDKKGARLLDTTIREEGDTDKKLTKLAKSVINLRAKRASKKIAKEQRGQGITGALTRMVKKVTGSRRRRRR